ncbi:helix-turn-helix domain-containing protein [Parabacteroides sp. PF5-9]|uniref:helix-turn-helix domain-containing protein n=1 Tax=Parabacteroides sp. PF5-9 TaxID=1742404 RepID=UPI0024742FDD|nr:helix-turn-helix domain-containing protein [Parabacteroides sp. PF5-9]MDH6358735.1 AraC family transcriptional activator of pobA [Parabacteroides sp. PF5-9]
MQQLGNTTLTQLPENRKIEIFKLEQADDPLFDNYQRYDFYQLIWFIKAGDNPVYFLDFKEYTLSDNQFVLVFPGQIDMLDPQGKEGYIFGIDNDSFFRMNQRINSDYLNGYFSNIFLTPDSQTTSILKQLTDLMQVEYNGDNRLPLMESYMEAFLFHLSSLTANSAVNSNDFIISRLMRLIDIHFVTHRDTEFYARELGLTHKKANEECKKGTGKTIKQHIQERLILEIKKEIRLNRKSLKEISFDLGFSEPAYFTRFFKQQTATTPKAFREQQVHLSK